MAIARCPTCSTKFVVELTALTEDGPEVDVLLRSISRALAPKKKPGRKRGRPPAQPKPEPAEEIV